MINPRQECTSGRAELVRLAFAIGRRLSVEFDWYQPKWGVGSLMKFCVSTRTSGKRPIAETLELAAGLGYAGVEIWSDDLDSSGERPSELRGRAERLGLTLLVHAYTNDNLTARKEENRLRAFRRTRYAMETAVKLGASVCVVHPGRRRSAKDDAEGPWPLMVEAFTRLTGDAERLGLTLAIEHMEPVGGQFFCRAADVQRLFDAVPMQSLGLTLDLAHAANHCRMTGDDLTAFIEGVERVVHVHLSDGSPANHHVPLGEGDWNIAGMLDLLRRRGYEGTVTVEGRARDRELDAVTANREFLRELGFWEQSAHVAV